MPSRSLAPCRRQEACSRSTVRGKSQAFISLPRSVEHKQYLEQALPKVGLQREVPVTLLISSSLEDVLKQRARLLRPLVRLLHKGLHHHHDGVCQSLKPAGLAGSGCPKKGLQLGRQGPWGSTSHTSLCPELEPCHCVRPAGPRTSGRMLARCLQPACQTASTRTRCLTDLRIEANSWRLVQDYQLGQATADSPVPDPVRLQAY